MTKRQDRDAIYVKRQFDTKIIVLCVRWYITYRASCRDLVAMIVGMQWSMPLRLLVSGRGWGR